MADHLLASPEFQPGQQAGNANTAPSTAVEPGVRPLREMVARRPPAELLPFSELPKYRTAKSANQFVKVALLNPINMTIIDRLPALGLDDVWLTSGCLFQSVWNLLAGRSVTEGIRDYDLFYYDDDVSWEAENEVIKKVCELFADLDAHIEIRNQARVHLWYEEKFGISYPPLRSARHAIRRFPTRASAVGITKLSDGRLVYYAPFGFKELFDMEIRPNRRLEIEDVYNKKAERWAAQWPMLKLSAWHDHD